MRNYKLFINDIIESIDDIESFIGGVNLKELIADKKTSSAVIRKLEVIGEAAKNIPKGIKEKYPDLPWKSMSGMRDRLTHTYFGIDYKLVWDVIKKETSKIKSRLQEILVEFNEEK